MAEAQPKIICSMVNVSKKHAQKFVLKDIYLSYFYGAKIGVLGLNGSGKSSLLRILAGVDTNFDGQLIRDPQYRVGYLEQEPKLEPGQTVRQAVLQGAKGVMDLLAEFDRISDRLGEDISDAEMTKLLDKQGEVQERLDALEAWTIDQQIEMAMDALRCPDPEAKVDVLSGGERRRVALCRLLLERPDILLLDEPTNHLDAETVAWLEQHLQRYEGTVIAVTHDRYFLDNAAGWILELDRGEGIPFKGNYSSWLEQKHERLRVEERAESKRQKAIERELEWVRKSPSGRQAKSRARLSAYDSLVEDSRDKAPQEVEIFIPAGPRLGNKVISAQGLMKTYGDRILFEDLTFEVPPAAIVGIIGPNGAGKTTLFRILTGQEKPDAGKVSIGETVKMAYVEQSRDVLDAKKSVWEVISGGQDEVKLGSHTVNSRAYVARFSFLGPDQQRAVGTLSGGERNRVHLARMLKENANVILLDEPTNDLDVNTIRALEEGLQNFAGCALIISHDRWFLDRIATHILAFEGDSKAVFFTGNWTQYEEARHKRLGAEADRPHRIKYRRLTTRGA